MNGFTVKKLIATGGSQGGIRLLSYANGVQQTENVYNALLLAMGSGQAIDFKADIAEDTSAVANSTPAEALAARALSDSRRLRPVQVRNDLSVPVMVFNSEAESDWAFDARQPETDKYRHWEIAGARHGSTKKMHFASLKSDRDGLTFNVTNNPSSFLFTEADWQPAMAAAFWHISNWIDGGNPPPSIPPIEIVKIDDVIQTSRDRYGNAIGGVRLPAIEAPIAHLVIATRARMRAEGLRGQYTIPFSTAYLKQLYPTHNDYVIKVTEAVNKAKAAGVMLQHAAADYIKQAEAASIPEIAYPDSVRALLRF
jgi:hypothetical protein